MVLYGANNNWFAAYAFWLLKYRGFDDVKLLNGGRKKWELEDRPLTSELPDVRATDFSIRGSERPELRAVRDHVLDTLEDDPFFPTGEVNGLYRVDGPTDLEIVADIGAFSMANPPQTDFVLATGVLYAMEPFRGGFLITDGHHNRLLWVSKHGEITEFRTFGNIVPTGLEVHGHTVYMNEAGPVPHHPEDGKIVAIDAKTGTVTPLASGAPLLVDVEFGLGRTLYGLSQGHWSGMFGGDGSPADPLTGSLVKLEADGSFTVLATALNIPTSMEIIGNTAYVVTLLGEVWKIPGISPPPYGRNK